MINEKQQHLVIEWLFSSDTGISSKALASEYLGVGYGDQYRPPCDPSDLGRCLRLIRIVPQVRLCVDTLAERYGLWKRAAQIWDEAAKSMESEVGLDWEKGRVAEKTYRIMKDAGL